MSWFDEGPGGGMQGIVQNMVFGGSKKSAPVSRGGGQVSEASMKARIEMLRGQGNVSEAMRLDARRVAMFKSQPYQWTQQEQQMNASMRLATAGAPRSNVNQGAQLATQQQQPQGQGGVPPPGPDPKPVPPPPVTPEDKGGTEGTTGSTPGQTLNPLAARGDEVPGMDWVKGGLPGLSFLPGVLGAGLGALGALGPEPQFHRQEVMSNWDKYGKDKFGGIWKDSDTNPYQGDFFRNAQRSTVTGTNAMIENNAQKQEQQRLAGGTLMAGGNERALAAAAPGFYHQTARNLETGYDIRNQAANFRNQFNTYNTDKDYQSWETDYANGRLNEQNRGLNLVNKAVGAGITGFMQGMDFSSSLFDMNARKAMLEQGLGKYVNKATADLGPPDDVSPMEGASYSSPEARRAAPANQLVSGLMWDTSNLNWNMSKTPSGNAGTYQPHWLPQAREQADLQRRRKLRFGPVDNGSNLGPGY